MLHTSAFSPRIDLETKVSSGVRLAYEAANRAASAFAGWTNVSAKERSELLGEMANVLESGRSELLELAAEEVGASPPWVDFNIRIAKDTLMQARDLIPLLGDQETKHEDGRVSVVRRQSVGVVLGFAPWNAPIILATRAMAAPLACGNTVVLKASEHCPQTHKKVVELFSNAGLPDNVVNIVTNEPSESLEVASALVAHPTIRRVNFTGSTRVGQLIAIEAARAMKRCVMELSGKASLIVLSDADLEAAAAAAMTGAFFNQGQVCMSTERVVVVEDKADEFVAKLLEKTSHLSAADPRLAAAPLGRLIDANAVVRVKELVEDAVKRGACILSGGETSGEVMQPVILDNVTPSMRIFREENFGPVASIIRVPNEEAAVSVANDTEFGLAAAVFSSDLDKAMNIAARLETGICQINGPTIFDDPTMPFGGVKASGYGRFGGTAALDEFTEIRWLSQHHGLDAKQIEEMLNLGRRKA